MKGKNNKQQVQRDIINNQIRAQEVRLIDEAGENVGVVPTKNALQRAEDVELDLVLISPTANPPVAKIIDYGKFRYEQQKKQKEMKANQKIIVIKEIRLSPTIDKHDFTTKAKHARKFLEEGDKVQVSIRFRGRMITHSEFGLKVINEMIEELADISDVDQHPKMDGRRMLAMLAPKKK
ncbi:MAG: translation initiation factor IF-3 [Mycoplasmatales bacterium]